jgi:CHAT domain-containing protein
MLLVYHIVGDEVMAFLCKDGKIEVFRQLTTATQVQQLQERLAAQWARFRTGQPFVERHLQQMKQSTQRLLHLLYMELIEPMQGLLDTAGASIKGATRRIVIVPHGLLHQLPFHALYDGAQYLLERFVISYAPSATVFQLCRHRQPRRSGPVLAVSVADAQIPAAVEEVCGVAARLSSQFPRVQVLMDQEATLENIAAQAVNCSILHLACHGLFRRDNPMFSALRLYDGWLTAANVAQLQLSGALVTLSTCESGRSQVMGGDEIIGLTYAFLSAGAATLLVSQWLVQDSATAMLMDVWYRHFSACDDMAAALRVAQLEVMAIHPHPYYWAPFTLVGQRFRMAAYA